jgi:hypothetical protein
MLNALQSQFACLNSLNFDGLLLREQGETLSSKALQILAYFRNNCKRMPHFLIPRSYIPTSHLHRGFRMGVQNRDALKGSSSHSHPVSTG